MSKYAFGKIVGFGFEQAIERVTTELGKEGFGILSEIDVAATMKKKINVDMPPYKILGACNPQFAYNAISLESHIGVMLPCNVVIQEHENGEVEVSAINPIETVGRGDNNTPLRDLAAAVSDRLRIAVDDLQRVNPEPHHADALPGAREMITIAGEE